jgi:uncharacterized protein YqgC (DUF456 family)
VEIVGIILLIIILIISIAVIPFGIPGTFIIVGTALVYGLITGFAKISLSFVGLLLLMSLMVEFMEEILSVFMTKKLGGSRMAMFGALIGGFIGAVIGTGIAPVAGTLLGGFTGAFTGAFLLEWLNSQNVNRALKVGLGAFFGSVSGKITKILVGLIMSIMIVAHLF